MPLPSAGQQPDSVPAPDSAAVQGGLQLLLTGRTELGGEWARFRPCDPNLQFGCNPTLLPRFRPDAQFAVRVSGSVFDRVHVDVDFDQTREFSAANNINIFYEGQGDEILQRVEVGDVTFRLPDSRFLTEGVPAGNFGFRALARIGNLDIQTVWAQQRGDLSSAEFFLTDFGGDARFVRQDTVVVDDADYVQGQFFFLTDPAALRGHPHLRVVDLVPDDAPLDEAPGPSPVQLYRFENDPVTRQQVEGYIQADARFAANGDTVQESGWFRYLVPDVDYTLHSSGLWVVLRSPLRGDEMLAVTYVAASGDTIGDYNPERIHNQGGRPRLRLLRASSPNHQPGRPTWELEMHQIYRVSGARGVLEPSVQLQISLGELSGGRTFGRQSDGREVPYLQLFGVDEEAPVDRVDLAALFTPAELTGADPPPVLGTYLVFPTLEPFARPPAVPALGLSDVGAGVVLGGAANPTIYEDPDPFERRTAGLFQLTFVYTVENTAADDAIALGAFAIRDGSERLFLDNRPLVRGVDYLIDYDIGTVTLLDPGLVDPSRGTQSLRASWEQKTLFELAPTSVFGLNARYDLGDRGAVNFLSMAQNEESLVRRPQLGTEPRSAVVGGLSAELHLGGPWLTRALNQVPGLSDGSPGRLDIRGEIALSLPDPNTQKDVFLDDFDGTNDLVLPRISSDWTLGSAPSFLDGMEGILTDVVTPGSAADLTWQHRWVQVGAEGDSVGVFEGFFPSEDIDRQINVTGGQTRETGLRIALGQPGETFSQMRWRSMTAALSSTGLDLSRSEFLEFYMAGGDSVTLFVDLGTVNEDAFFVDPSGNLTGVQSDGDPWGLGRLDQEADPRKGEIWSTALDAIGLWGEDCEASLGAVYREGDPRANCTRGNGRADTEDLDNDGSLDTAERSIRFAVPLDGSSPFVARDRSETETSFRLYRIPLRGPDGINVQGRFTEADWRGIKHVRFTFATPRPAELIITRARVTGSRWVNRAQEGALLGLGGDTLGSGGRVAVSSVSAVTRGEVYASPPGVVEALDDVTSTFSGQGFEFNEQSLGISYDGIAPGERVEVFNRFPQRPRNFLTYRQARIWAVGRAGDWGPESPSWFMVKVGSDANNFYLYRARLPGTIGSGVEAADWLPEIVIDFDEWLVLRRRAEETFVTDPPRIGDPPRTVWSPDSTYAVVLQDRARAPTLAAVRELSVGVYNAGTALMSGEVWVDEFRLSGAVREPGAASTVEVDLGNDVWSTRLSVTRQSPYFRQLRDAPTYLSDDRTEVASTFQAGSVLPRSWRLDMPLTVSWAATDEDPLFLRGTDIRTGQLSDLRQPGARSTRVSLTVRRRPAPEGVGSLLDGLQGSVSWSRGSQTTITSEGEQRGLDLRMGYQRAFGVEDVPVVPGFLERGLARVLPDAWSRHLAQTRLRWSPEWVSLRAGYTDLSSSVSRFDRILTSPEEPNVLPFRAPRQGLETAADVRFRPLAPVLAEFGFSSTRDLLPAREQVADPDVQALLVAERWEPGPLDLGWETRRGVHSRVEVRPEIRSWLGGRLGWVARYGSDRNAAFARRVPAGPDTTVELTRNLSGDRTLSGEVRFDPAGLAGTAEDRPGFLADVGRALRPVVVTWTDGLAARFTRDAVDPGLGYQLGLLGERGFRVIDGDTAAVLTDRGQVRVASGFRIPGLFGVDVAWAEASLDAVDRRSRREATDRTWPDVRLRLERVPLPTVVAAAVERIGASGGILRSVTRTEFGGVADQRRERVDRRVPVDVGIEWRGGVRTTYRATFRDGTVRDPTGETRTDGRIHNVSLSTTLRPVWLFARLDGPLRLSVRYAYAQDVECRRTTANARCVPFIDQLNRSVNLTLDSRLSDADVGVQLSWVDRQSYIGQRIGSSQFQLLVFGRFALSSTVLAPS